MMNNNNNNNGVEDDEEAILWERVRKKRKADVVGSKAAVIGASGSVAAVLTHNLPIQLSTRQTVLAGCGILIDCHPDDSAEIPTYLTTVIAPAFLFQRDDRFDPYLIQVDVYISDGKLYNGKLLTYDFHYNLAAIMIKSDHPLPTTMLKPLDDVASIDPIDHHKVNKPFQLQPHSKLFKILPGDEVMTLRRTYGPPYHLLAHSGVFCTYDLLSDHDCKELYWVKDCDYEGDLGGVVVNCSGEVIGIMFDDSRFLPSNLILRWWNCYKSNRELCRPRLGVEVGNLNAAQLGFLEQFKIKFPDVGTGVIVTKIEEDTPAYVSKLRPNDVIVKCDGKAVRSKMEFFEKLWDGVGKSVELHVLRVSDGLRLNLSVSIENTAPDTFYRWQLPSYKLIKVA